MKAKNVRPSVKLCPWDPKLMQITTHNVAIAVDAVNAALQRGTVDGINLYGFIGKPVEFLANLRPMKRVSIQSCRDIDITPLRRHKGLVELKIGDNVEIDLSYFPKLKSFFAHWHPRSIGLDTLRSLNDARLSALDDRYPDIKSIGLSPTLQRLDITASKIKSLNGIDKLPKLLELQLAHIRNPLDCSSIGASCSLVDLEFQNIPHLKNIDRIGRCPSITGVGFLSCGQIPNISWLEKLKKLEAFKIYKTPVADADFSAILRLPKLEWFRGTRRADYKPSIKYLEKFVDDRNKRSK